MALNLDGSTKARKNAKLKAAVLHGRSLEFKNGIGYAQKLANLRIKMYILLRIKTVKGRNRMDEKRGLSPKSQGAPILTNIQNGVEK